MMFRSKVGFSTLPTSRRQKAANVPTYVVLKVDRFSRHINAHINVPHNQSERRTFAEMEMDIPRTEASALLGNVFVWTKDCSSW
jgi:hypothetical protein